MYQNRRLNNREKAILEYFIKQGSLQLPNGWSQNLLVQQMDDGGMGGFLVFLNSNNIDVKRRFGKQVDEFEFVDDDGVPVLVSLNADQQNEPFEVDIWKIDYKPVINFKIPI